MNFTLRIAACHIPDFLRKRELKKLFHLTATAFGDQMPSIKGLSMNECLAEYARFTKSMVDRSISQGKNIPEIQNRLFNQAYKYGDLWRKRFGVSDMKGVMKAGQILYHAIGIEFHGNEQGAIEIGSCYFSSCYSPETCKIISSLDAGIMAGLSGGSRLSLSQRITEGFDFCKAQLIPKESEL